jgi:hypothetical protein
MAPPARRRQLLLLAACIAVGLVAGCGKKASVPGPGDPPQTEEQPKPVRKGEVRVEVRFTVKQFDPKTPKEGAVECLVQNDTDGPIRIPTNYTSWGFDSDVVLFGRPARAFQHEMRLVGQRKERIETIWADLPPGESRVVFTEGLGTLLMDEKGYRWSWEA